jgi:hypothetical protein
MTGEWRRAVGESRDTRFKTPRAEYLGFCFLCSLHHKQAGVFAKNFGSSKGQSCHRSNQYKKTYGRYHREVPWRQ